MPHLITAVVTTLALTVPPAGEWTETPTGQQDGILYAVDAAAGSVWAVGIDRVDPTFRPAALRRTGGRWVPTTQPVADGRLLDVAVRRPDDVWAVGERDIPAEGGGRMASPLAQRWNGRRWQVVAPPAPAGAEQGELTAVASTSRAGTWAGGWSYADATGWRTFVVRYDHRGWHPVTDALSTDLGYLWDLLPLGANDVWAAGEGLAHYDGRRWTRTALPGDGRAMVIGLAANGPRDVWAVGLREDPVLWKRPLIMHFDGKVWTEQPTPADSAILNSVELVGGEPVALGETRAGQAYVLRRATNGDFAATAAPPGAGSLLGSTVSGRRLWVAGTASDWSSPYAGFEDLDG